MSSLKIKHIVYLLIVLGITTFLLSGFRVFVHTNHAASETVAYIENGFSVWDENLEYDDTAAAGSVNFYFYLLLSGLIVLAFFYDKRSSFNSKMVNLVFMLAAGLSIYLLMSEAIEEEMFYWQHTFSLLVLALTYGLTIVLWKQRFPEIRFTAKKTDRATDPELQNR